jgi:hypothetical protein
MNRPETHFPGFRGAVCETPTAVGMLAKGPVLQMVLDISF